MDSTPATTSPEAIEALLCNLNRELDPHSHIPLYQQMASMIERWIEEGRLRPGDRLTPERRMTELLDVSRRTVRTALSELTRRRYLSTTHGRGYFVMGKPPTRTLNFLALERFSTDHRSVPPQHYEVIHQTEAENNLVVNYRYVPTLESLRQTLLNPPEGCDGLLLFRPLLEWETGLLAMGEELLKEMPVPLVVVGRDLSGSRFNFISPDHLGQTREATRRLIALGHRRIGYISGPLALRYLQISREGYFEAMKEANLPVHDSDHLALPMRLVTTHAEDTVHTFLRERQFSALVVTGSAFSALFENAVQRTALVIPRELSVVMVTEQHHLEASTLRWSAILYANHQTITRSLHVLSGLATGQLRGPVQELIPPGTVEGATCAPFVEENASGLKAGATLW